jgi:hypothetical protein
VSNGIFQKLSITLFEVTNDGKGVPTMYSSNGMKTISLLPLPIRYDHHQIHPEIRKHAHPHVAA